MRYLIHLFKLLLKTLKVSQSKQTVQSVSIDIVQQAKGYGKAESSTVTFCLWASN